MQRKYLILDDCFPVLFTGALKHDKISTAGRKVTSAGFFEINDGKVRTFGESVSLMMRPGEFDAQLIQKMLFSRE